MHPNIAELRDAFISSDGWMCVVLEWANAGSLLRHIQDCLHLAADEVLVMREPKARWGAL